MGESLVETFPILELLQDCCDPPLTPLFIEELEMVLGVRLPVEYREFLLQFNGGFFQRGVSFRIPKPTRFVTGAVLNDIIGQPSDGIESYGLVSCADTFSDRLPENVLAVAHCNGSDLVVLRFQEHGSGFEGVWFWDSDAFWMDEDTPAFYWLADSFNAFLSMLNRDDDLDEEELEHLPLFQAIEHGNFRAVEQYVAGGGDLEARNDEGHTLLSAAIIHTWPRIVRILIEHSADLNARDRQGRTPLHHAADHSFDSVKLLLRAGADAKARDNEGKSVLADWSYSADQWLIRYGAEP